MVYGLVVMAKKKPRSADPESGSDRVVIIHLKGSGVYSDWLDRLNKHTSIPKAQMFRLAMIDYAKKIGFEQPPEM